MSLNNLSSRQKARSRYVAWFVGSGGRPGDLSWTEAIGAVQGGQDALEVSVMDPQELPHVLFGAAGLNCFAGDGFDAGL